MSQFQGYDQWKTASPYDDEPDVVEEAQRFLDDHKESSDSEIKRACTIIFSLLGEL